MLKILPVFLAVLLLCGCTIQSLQTTQPTLDSVDGFAYTNPKYTSATTDGFFLFPVFPLWGVGGLFKIDGSDSLYEDAYTSACEKVGADCMIHYSYELKVDWYWIVGWAHVTCSGTGVNYAH